MNDFLFFFGSLFTVAFLAGVWCGVKELFTRWLNNDWCHHDWGMWETRAENTIQIRFCKKCNRMEKRIL